MLAAMKKSLAVELPQLCKHLVKICEEPLSFTQEILETIQLDDGSYIIRRRNMMSMVVPEVEEALPHLLGLSAQLKALLDRPMLLGAKLHIMVKSIQKMVQIIPDSHTYGDDNEELAEDRNTLLEGARSNFVIIQSMFSEAQWHAHSIAVLEDLLQGIPDSNQDEGKVNQSSEVDGQARTDNEKYVIEEVIHMDPAAEPHPNDSVFADQLWASAIEAQMLPQSASSNGTINDSEAEPKDDIYLLQFNRDPAVFHTCLEGGTSLKSCRDALEQAGHQWKLESNAKIFVHPMQYPATIQYLDISQQRLRPYHVVVAQSLEYLVEESLSGTACRQGARIKKRIFLGSGESQKRARVEPEGETRTQGRQDSEDGAPMVNNNEVNFASMGLDTKRTFLCCLPRLREARTVNQSTTEATTNGGLNPRRLQDLSLSD